MSDAEINIGGRGRNKLPEVTEEEDEQIREDAECFGVKKSTKSGGSKILHPVIDGDTLCKIEKNNYKEKDVATFPQGFFPICKRCAYYWRQD